MANADAITTSLGYYTGYVGNLPDTEPNIRHALRGLKNKVVA